MKEYTISCTTKKFKEIADSRVKPDFETLVSDIDGMEVVEIFGRGRFAKVNATDSAVGVFEQAHADDYIVCVDVPVHTGCTPKFSMNQLLDAGRQLKNN